VRRRSAGGRNLRTRRWIAATSAVSPEMRARSPLGSSSLSARNSAYAAPARKSPGPATAAIALRAVLPEATILTGAERQLFDEWLNRLAASRPW
jgi:hypothetical protein